DGDGDALDGDFPAWPAADLVGAGPLAGAAYGGAAGVDAGSRGGDRSPGCRRWRASVETAAQSGGAGGSGSGDAVSRAAGLGGRVEAARPRLAALRSPRAFG